VKNDLYAAIESYFGIRHQSFADAGFYENTGSSENIEVIFDFGSGNDSDRLGSLNGTNYGSFSSSDQWDLKGGVLN
jgi:hypothetical protein